MANGNWQLATTTANDNGVTAWIRAMHHGVAPYNGALLSLLLLLSLTWKLDIPVADPPKADSPPPSAFRRCRRFR
jgi:hypothetical protein